jgi:SAM-dependent methyltransferase
LVPPEELLFDGTLTQEDFRHAGPAFVKLFLVERAMLKPHERVLDVGCGNGQKARPLVNYLTEQGSYDGFDVVRKGIEWCAERYRKFPDFRFQIAADVGVISFSHACSEVCRIADLNSPEAAVAYDEQHIRQLYDRFGFSVCDVAYGYWCGRKDLRNLLQDVVVAVKG